MAASPNSSRRGWIGMMDAPFTLPRVLRVGAAFPDTRRIDVDANTARSQLHGCDHDATVAATQVVDDVVRADLRELERGRDDVVRRGLVVDVRNQRRRLRSQRRGLTAATRGGGNRRGESYGHNPAFAL
jgi:hypothetical protein